MLRPLSMQALEKKNCAIFMQPLFTFHPVAFLFSYTVVIHTLSAAVTATRIPRVRIVNHFFEIVLHNLTLEGPYIIFCNIYKSN